MFDDLLKTVVSSVEGALVCSVVGFDGITVEAQQGAPSPVTSDLSQAWVEYANAIHQFAPVVQGLKIGAVAECTVTTAHTCTVIRLLNDDYFLALGMSSSGNFGKGRYMLRLAAPVIAKDL